MSDYFSKFNNPYQKVNKDVNPSVNVSVTSTPTTPETTPTKPSFGFKNERLGIGYILAISLFLIL
jgi:hypothetical protein